MSAVERSAKLALDCRKVRLFIAAHPGSTSKEIAEGTGIRYSRPLFKMVVMGLIRFTQERQEDGRRPQRWFVIPQ
jgi:hypothetical protein